jgi:hypothetical protein
MTSEEKLTPAAQLLVPALREQQRIERRSRPLPWTMVAAAAVGAAAIVFLSAHALATDEVTNQLQVKGQERDRQISGIQDQLKGVCRKISNPSSLTPEEREGCYRAENSIPPVPAQVTVTQVPSRSGPTLAEVQSLIAAALVQVPRPLTVEQVAAVAQQVFAANAASLGPSPEKLADAVSGFCAQDACRGPQGAKGEAAPAVTDEQIRTQVNAFCAENGGCIGPPGKTGDRGAQGISVQSFSDPHADPNDSSKCVITVTLIDPETDPMSHPTQTFNVPRVFCLPG